MRSCSRVVVLAALTLTPAIQLFGADPASLRLIPFPKQVQLHDDVFALDRALVLSAPQDVADLLGEMVGTELQRAGLPRPEVTHREASPPVLCLAPGVPPVPELAAWREGATPEDYDLEVGRDAIVCRAPGAPGLFYAVQTLCQLIRANRQDKSLPGVSVRDWPALRWRCFQDDMTRGPSSKPETLQFEVAWGAHFKLNLFTYYMEYQYAFQKHPLIGPVDGSLTPADLAALVDYARRYHVDILGNQQSFGHFERILRHEQYAALRENESVLSPVNEDSYRLLDDLYSEVCPLLPFPFFNVCCDETWGLGSGPSKALADKIGTGGVYVQHVRRVHDLLKDRYHKRMMMWGDIILQHPDQLQQVPQDTIMLTWGYGDRDSFEDQIIPFQKSGYEFFVCPGTSNWSRILPDFGVAATNIRHFVRDGIRHGAIGMLNTTWEDDGESHNGVNWPGYAWGAECAWGGDATSPHQFYRRLGAVLFGESGDHFGSAIELLARTHKLPGMLGMNNKRFWQDDFPPRNMQPAAARESAQQLLEIVRPAIDHLTSCQQEATVNRELLDPFLFGARRMEWIGQRMLDGLQVAELYDRVFSASPTSGDPAAQAADLARTRALTERNLQVLDQLNQQFQDIWLRESKPYALDWTLPRYAAARDRYQVLLTKLADAERRIKAGEPLADPAELGIALPAGLSRRTRPTARSTASLQPQAPWLEPSSDRRLGLAINALQAARENLPVELDLEIPLELSTRFVRAFVLHDSDAPREILAQLDPVPETNLRRLTLLIPGLLPVESQTFVHVYFGVQQPPALASAARTHPEENGAVWLENDCVRLLLGPEGAHIFRWEIKSLNGRDVTMPGETGWAGFADVSFGHRSLPNTLTCLADGPAVVRFACRDAEGLCKKVSLFGGVCWLEVELNNAVEQYWDFDDPTNFAADGLTPGTYLFSNGVNGSVGCEADGVPAQVKAVDTYWGVKYQKQFALALVTPEMAAFHHVAPGAGAGGVGIEGSPPAAHFVTFAGPLADGPREMLERLRQTLNFRTPPEIVLHAWQQR